MTRNVETIFWLWRSWLVPTIHILSIIIEAIVNLIDGVMTMFAVGSRAEKHIAENGRLGESQMDQDARRWQDRVTSKWWAISAALSLIGIAVWYFASH